MDFYCLIENHLLCKCVRNSFSDQYVKKPPFVKIELGL